MTQKKIKTCSWIGCKKEVYTPKALLCGQHEREGRENLKLAGKVLGGTFTVLSTLAGLGKLKK